MQAILLPHLSSDFGFQPLLLNIPALNRTNRLAMGPYSRDILPTVFQLLDCPQDSGW